MLRKAPIRGKIEIRPSFEAPKAVVLISHGLNNSQACLTGLAKFLTTHPSVVVNLLLSGHDSKERITRKDWDLLWLEDMTSAIHEAHSLARTHQLPLCFFGYSLSCIVFLKALERLDIVFDRVILMSPPLIISKRVRVLEVLGFLGIPWIPSLNKPEYRVHDYLPIAMYRSLFRLIRGLKTLPAARLPDSGMILLDPCDEMVNYDRVEKWVRQYKRSWAVVPILAGEHLQKVYHHLLCMESNVGPGVAGLLRDLCHEFLSSGKAVAGLLRITPYEHFFLNKESAAYPPSIFVHLLCQGRIEQARFEEALGKAQMRHPMLRARINGQSFQRRQRLRWLILNTGFAPYVDWQESQEAQAPSCQEIHLLGEIGLRVYVRVMAEQTSILFQFHHACLDGFGALQFLRSFFAYYEKPETSSSPPKISELVSRAIHYDGSWSKLWQDLSLLVKWGRFRASPVLSSSRKSLSPGKALRELRPLGRSTIDRRGLRRYDFSL